MKMLLLVSILGLSSLSHASSDLKLKGCLTLVYNKAANFNGTGKDVLKLVSTGTKQCRDGVREMVKVERETKRRTKIAAQIAKLQAKLK